MERVVVLAMAVVCIVLLPIVGLIFHVVHQVNPEHFKLSATSSSSCR
jgi:hypothetical protein